MSDLQLATDTAAATVEAPVGAGDPLAVYLARLTAAESRRAMAASLELLAELLADGQPADRTERARRRRAGQPLAVAVPWHHLRYGHTQALRSWLAEHCSPAAANRHLAALRGVLREAWRLGLMNGEDLARAIDLASISGTSLPAGRYVEDGEVRRLVAACLADPSPGGRRDAAVLAVLFVGGLRRAEAVALDVDHYDSPTGQLIVTGKGRRQRRTALPAGGRRAMAAWLVSMERPAPFRSNKCVGHPRWRGRSHIRKEPAVPSVSHLGPTHLGLDVHKDTISVAILAPDRDGPDVERIAHDEASVRRLVGRFPDPRWLRACYEAGPTGFELARLLHSMQVRCEVIAPSLIPKAPGDKVKTDRRDCRRLARLHRAGELVAIRIPTIQEEAVRDLCRARADMVEDRTRARHRLSKFLLRHGRPWRGGSAWTLTHERWLLGQRFDQPALAATYAHYRAVLAARGAALEAIEADLAIWYDRPPFANAVHRLSAYRGITRLGALTLASEVGDWRRFPRAAAFTGFCGLVPSEYSSGTSTRRGHITKTGNAHLRAQLVESAWAYQHRPAVGLELHARQQGLDPQAVARAWAAQLRLCGRFRRLAARKDSKNVVATAIARELAGFLWAEMAA